jgi:CheY-like chemotaxis protein
MTLSKQAIKVFAGWTVLVVDDEPDNLDVARRMLVRVGATVKMAENGELALALLKEMSPPPDFMLVDLSMPRMDGWAFLTHVREMPEYANIPLIALTAHALLDERNRALAAGFNGFISKPISIERFITDVIAYLTAFPSLKQRLPDQ